MTASHCFKFQQNNHQFLRIPKSINAFLFHLSMVIGEYLSLIVRVKEEGNAWQANKNLIENDPNSADYEVNEWSQLYDHKNRLPRSAGQLKELGHKNALKTVWYIRKDIFKHLNKLKSSESKSTELESCVLKLKKFGVCKWFKSYVCTFFPGRLDEARGFGLLQDDEEQNGLLHKEEEEQKDDKNWLDFL